MLLSASLHCFSSNNKLNEIFMKKKRRKLFLVHILEVTVYKQIYFLLV